MTALCTLSLGETQPGRRGLTLSLRETAGWPYD
jgi:hypothetical protein